jgi:hypothetical protein
MDGTEVTLSGLYPTDLQESRVKLLNEKRVRGEVEDETTVESRS